MIEYNMELANDLLKHLRSNELKAYLIDSVAEFGHSEHDFDIVLILPPDDWQSLVHNAILKCFARYDVIAIDFTGNDWYGTMFHVFCKFDIINVDIFVLMNNSESHDQRKTEEDMEK